MEQREFEGQMKRRMGDRGYDIIFIPKDKNEKDRIYRAMRHIENYGYPYKVKVQIEWGD